MADTKLKTNEQMHLELDVRRRFNQQSKSKVYQGTISAIPHASFQLSSTFWLKYVLLLSDGATVNVNWLLQFPLHLFVRWQEQLVRARETLHMMWHGSSPD